MDRGYSSVAVWYVTQGELRDLAPGLSRVLRDVNEVVPELCDDSWSFFVGGSFDVNEGVNPEDIAASIKIRPVTGAWRWDGSPVTVERGGGSAYVGGEPGRFDIENNRANLRFYRDDGDSERQEVDLTVRGVSCDVLRVTVRSMVTHLEPDFVWGVNDDFVSGLRAFQTAGRKFVPMVGVISWVRGLSADELVGHPVVNVEDYHNGLYFEAVSDQAGSALAALSDHLEHIKTRERLGMDPYYSPAPGSVYEHGTPLFGDRSYQARVVGVELPGDGGVPPVYEMRSFDGKPELVFHGHVSRSVTSEDGHDQLVEVFLTALGGFPADLSDDLITKWGELARQQLAVIPEGGRNEWHLDNETLADRVRHYFQDQGIETEVIYHPKPTQP